MGPGPKKVIALEKKMKELGIHKEDFEEKFIKSSGRGGQKVNKSSSAVFLKHKKTGLSVKCGKARSLHLNRFLAMISLVDKIEKAVTGQNKETQAIEKIKKQKKRRKRKSKKKLEITISDQFI